MECPACSRHDSRAFYCAICVTNRLAEHYSRRKQYRDALTLATSKAAALLQPPSASNVLGVREESVLKAEKWTLATRLRDLRVASEKTRESITADREALEERRAALAKRKDNLSRARTLLDNLTSPTATASTPASLAGLQAQQAVIQRQHQALLLRTSETRLILTRELLSVYAFGSLASNRPLPSPFKSPSSSTSSISSSTSSVPSSLSSTSGPHVIHLPTYTLAHLPLPTISSLPTLSPPHLSATLSHLLHLTRLLALYFDLLLPFTPLPSLFGPGRPGVRAAPGWGEGVVSAGGPGLPTWPLFLSRSSKSSGSNSYRQDLSSSTMLIPPGEAGGQQSGGRELESTMREREKRQDRMKAVVTGAAALAYDLAWIVWKKGAEVSVNELDDLGSLIAKAVGGLSVAPGTRGRPTAPPALRPHSAKFPLDFSLVVSRFTTPRPNATTKGDGITGEESAEEEWDLV
ncbi:UV radiation resistance protein/autophagy-related protein 14 [Leucosporidium creatinivorum]|uniref:Autophagy-related protein 14 n=1 Tax=Leucosporidium creatinivorum TaxID=106004 RepID=A0A1Y2G0B4_9BASI|nr:UV radiation resistance protein/autophagy-related protein 14 [Leucosporidium creatinivorum]